jgi:hypothetical protein
MEELHFVQGLIAPQRIGAPEVDALVLLVGQVRDGARQFGRTRLVVFLRALLRKVFDLGKTKPGRGRGGGRRRARRLAYARRRRSAGRVRIALGRRHRLLRQGRSAAWTRSAFGCGRRWNARVVTQYIGAYDRQHCQPADYPMTRLHSDLSPLKSKYMLRRGADAAAHTLDGRHVRLDRGRSRAPDQGVLGLPAARRIHLHQEPDFAGNHRRHGQPITIQHSIAS